MVDRYFKKTYNKNSNNYYLNVKGKEEVMQPATKKSKQRDAIIKFLMTFKSYFPTSHTHPDQPSHQQPQLHLLLTISPVFLLLQTQMPLLVLLLH